MMFRPYSVVIEYKEPDNPKLFVDVYWIRAWNAEDAKRRCRKEIEDGKGIPVRVAIKGTKLYDQILEESRARLMRR